MELSKIIKALRLCPVGPFCSSECPMYGDDAECFNRLKVMAADALEMQRNHIVALTERQKADTVEVIRCKVCRYSTDDACPLGRVWCKKICRYMKKESFCSYGKRGDAD